LENKKFNAVAVYPGGGDVGGVYVTNDTRTGFVKENDGLPSNPKVSALSGRVIQTRSGEETEMYIGLYENNITGAKIYKRTFVVDVEEIDDAIPIEYILKQNYPNPFNPNTTIEFSIPEQSFVKLEVFNTLGEKVITIVSEELNEGNYKFDWNAGSLPSGVYYYKLLANGFEQTRKLVLLK
jgi:hypothetical protein